MNQNKIALAVAAVLAAANVAVAEEAAAPLTANIGVVSNYMWRGVTQTKDGAAVQGGVDYADESGFSIGTWASNVDFGDDDPDNNINLPKYEWDIYAGYAEKLGDNLGFNLTTGYYAYPDGKDSNMWELGASGTWEIFTLGAAYTLDGQASEPAPFREGDLYYYGNLAFDLPINFKLTGTLGRYDFNDYGDEGDYTHWQVSLSKNAGDFGTFSLNYDQTDGVNTKYDPTSVGENDFVIDDDPKLWVGWKKTF